MILSDAEMHWSGHCFGLAADVRHQVSAHWSTQVSLELTRGNAHRTPRDAKEDFTSEADPTYTAVGLRGVLTP